MKKRLKMISMITVGLGIGILLLVFLPKKQESSSLTNDSLSYIDESSIEESSLVIQQDEGEKRKSDRQAGQSHTRIAMYLREELIWEMGDPEPEPIDFFRPEYIGITDELTRENIALFQFATPLTDEMLHTRGKYPVKIDCGGSVVDARLSVVDMTPPLIIVPQQTQYEIGDTILYKQGVSVIDNSGEELQLMLDSSEVMSNMAGTYTVYYSAVDSAGNVGSAQTKIIIEQGHQPTKEEVDALTEELLDSILVEDMTQFEQAEEIFEWVRSNVRYAADSNKNSLVQGAYDGIYYRTGDCYTYFATAAYLMDCCGIENLPVSRKSEEAVHYWSLVNVGSGWYHFDCSPHKNGYKCFMQTDAQVREYAQKYERIKNYYIFDETDRPDRAEEILFAN